MDINEFKQVLKNNVSELIALQEQCQNTDVKCAQSFLDTILWMKEINALKEELHDIHGSLKHTVQRERTAFNALVAAKDSADNIVDGISRAIVKAEQNTVIRATVCTEELAKVHQCTAAHIKTEKELLEEHSKKLAKHLQNNEGIWLSSRWLVFMIITQGICYIAIILWAFSK